MVHHDHPFYEQFMQNFVSSGLLNAIPKYPRAPGGALGRLSRAGDGPKANGR